MVPGTFLQGWRKIVPGTIYDFPCKNVPGTKFCFLAAEAGVYDVAEDGAEGVAYPD